MSFEVGDRIHGFAGGYFGRDSYDCRRVVAVGPDWVVTRNDRGVAEFVTGDLARVRAEGDDSAPGCNCPKVERVDKYSVQVGSVVVVADINTERRLASMGYDERLRFEKIMGGKS